jgi:YegS/Rv2252/BmrU family lipid kinase
LSARLQQFAAPGAHIVVAGGDGTVNSCLPALLKCDCTVGIIPLGTANDLARTLGLPIDPVEAAAIIGGQATRRIDVARVNDHYFVNAAGIGFSSDLRQDVDAQTKKTFGALTYALAVARRWRRRRAFTVEVSDGLEVRRKVVQATVANGKYYGGGMAIHEDAEIDDSRLILLLIEAQPLWRHLLHVTNLKTGVYDFDAPYFVGSAATLTLNTRRRKRVSTDGEDSTYTPASFSILPQALEVFVP